MRNREDNVVMHGELTGHAHRASGVGVAVYEGDGVEIHAPNGAVIEHEEHKAVTLPAGEYDVSRVLEYDHFAEEAREVQD